MFAYIQHAKIFWPVVMSITIYVVNMLRSQQFSSKNSFDDMAVNVNTNAPGCHTKIFFLWHSAALHFCVASHRTKAFFRNARWWNQKFLAAAAAENNSLTVVVCLFASNRSKTMGFPSIDGSKICAAVRTKSANLTRCGMENLMAMLTPFTESDQCH